MAQWKFEVKIQRLKVCWSDAKHGNWESREGVCGRSYVKAYLQIDITYPSSLIISTMYPQVPDVRT